MTDEQSNPVKVAIKMEVDGMAFYAEAAKNTTDPLGKKMFESFVEDERRHLQALENIFKGVSYMTFDEMFQNRSPNKTIHTIFSNAKKEMEKPQAQANPDDIKALVMAMKMEKEGYDYYIDISKNSENEDIRKLFTVLAKEENEHFTLLQNSHTFLTDTGNWYLWEEMGGLDGG